MLLKKEFSFSLHFLFTTHTPLLKNFLFCVCSFGNVKSFENWPSIGTFKNHYIIPGPLLWPGHYEFSEAQWVTVTWQGRKDVITHSYINIIRKIASWLWLDCKCSCKRPVPARYRRLCIGSGQGVAAVPKDRLWLFFFFPSLSLVIIRHMTWITQPDHSLMLLNNLQNLWIHTCPMERSHRTKKAIISGDEILPQPVQ